LPAGAAPVVLVSVDGMLPEYYLRADELGLKVPNLRQLMREGVHATGATSVLPSVTFPAHTTMVTGVSPARHGITNNAIFDPDGKLGGGWFFYFDDVKVPTLWTKARAAGLRTAAVSWPVTAGAPIDFDLPDMYPVTNLREAKNLIALTRTGGDAALLADLLLPAAAVDMRDEVRAQVAVRFARQKPDLLAVHFLELDETQHRFGPRSREALATLERIDALLGTLFAALPEEATVVVVSDHGFLPVKSEIHLSALLRTLGLWQVETPAGGTLPWRAAVNPASGTAAIMLSPLATAEDRRKLDQAVALLLSDPVYGVGRAFRGPELAATGGFPGAYVVLEARPGYLFVRGGETLPLVGPTTYGGTHGYDPRRPEMRASFLMRGPRVKRGQSLGLVRLLDVAPTVARVLGLELGQTEGRVMSVAFVPSTP
jgi:predicted AlkP superfamily pyrophosphatase or phosphodiesterase